jgi:hypothetical protein
MSESEISDKDRGRAARKVSKSWHQYLRAKSLAVIFNFWTLTTRRVIGKSWKTAEIAEC